LQFGDYKHGQKFSYGLLVRSVQLQMEIALEWELRFWQLCCRKF